ncbi:hypothetical protein Ancab_006413 [Ancistrocladus abbreviatus]
MGNSIGGSKKAKVMKTNGEYFKLKTPARAADVLKDYPTHVLLDSDEFLRFNLRAPPLEPEDQLKPKKVYLLFELPKFPGSGIAFRSLSLSAKDRLDLLMSSRRRRSVSDVSVAKKSAREFVDLGSRPVRVKVRLPRGQVERIMKESKDEVEMAQKIVDLCAGGACGGNRVARQWSQGRLC